MIDRDIIDRVDQETGIVDLMSEDGVELRRKGSAGSGDWEALCPFHADRNLGNFVVSERRNTYRCFACGAHGGPITWMMETHDMSFPDAVRYLAARLCIDIPGDSAPKPVVKPSKPRVVPERMPMLIHQPDLVNQYLHSSYNVLWKWLSALPWSEGNLNYLKQLWSVYMVGTCQRGGKRGRTIWWYVNENRQCLRGKIMKYMPDGHRDKAAYTTWVHSELEAAKRLDPNTYELGSCLFGMHLIDVFPSAEVCIVESEKTAIIAQAFATPGEKLFMATGGLSFLNAKTMAPIMERKRGIVLYPDVDGIEKWTALRNSIDYDSMRVSTRIMEHYIPELDGDKADIADILVRMIMSIPKTESTYDQVRRLLDIKEEHKALKYLIETFNCKII